MKNNEPTNTTPTTLERSGRFSNLQSKLDKIAHTPGGATLLLRAFLAVTFTFAGLQKLANPDFFKASAPASFQAQLRGAATTSPIHGLLSLVNHAPVLIAVLIAIGEVAVGIGTAVGLLGRVAALGGALLSLSFFLTISYTSSPYYYGSDIVFVFAWTPLILGGSGTYSLDALLRRRYVAELDQRAPRAAGELITRRAALRQLGAIGATAVVVGAVVGTVTGIARAANHSFDTKNATGTGNSGTTSTTTAPATTTTTGGDTTKTTTAPKSSGTKIATASAIAVGGAAAFTDPKQHIPAFVVHPDANTFVAFSAICTHAGCTVAFDDKKTEFTCPCHGSIFDAKTGAVIQGPATQALPSIAVTETNGEIFTTE